MDNLYVLHTVDALFMSACVHNLIASVPIMIDIGKDSVWLVIPEKATNTFNFSSQVKNIPPKAQLRDFQRCNNAKAMGLN